jgi:predicted nuclease with TOPRIM domain
MANHLTPRELADQLQMDHGEVIGRCVEMGIPIFHGRVDRNLFELSLRNLTAVQQGKPATDLHH